MDRKILAARLYAPGQTPRNVPLDTISVDDLVLDARIGVYDDEKQGTQRVRFSVAAKIHAAPHTSDELDSTISYDFIIDGIREIVASRHFNLVETLVEAIASHCLTDQRVAEIRVRAEKLDRLPGGRLGVEITRRQSPSEHTNVYQLDPGRTS